MQFAAQNSLEEGKLRDNGSGSFPEKYRRIKSKN
jgi:hypothetical protein